MYSMTTDKCRACEIGMKCAGTNQTYMLSGYYGQLESQHSTNTTNMTKRGPPGGIYTQICPKGYCCSTPQKYNVTPGCLFDPLNKTGKIDPHLLCGKNTNRDWR
eukprot:878380_1